MAADSGPGESRGFPTRRSQEASGPAAAPRLPAGWPVKRCAFLCGYANDDVDPEDPTKCMRWEYPNNAGRSDWYCGRVFAGRISHTMSREAYLKKLSTDKDELDTFREWRRGMLERRSNGKKQAFERAGGAAPPRSGLHACISMC